MKRVLIDECLPIQLYRWLAPIDARTVEFMGWKGKRDRDLLVMAKGEFDVLLTGDGFLDQEHDLDDYRLAVVVIRPTQIRTIESLVPQIAAAIDRIDVGERILLSALRAVES
jgi:predicted nuclease of predicted toxin-antitoxin system